MPKTTWCPRTHRGVRARRQRLVRHAQDHVVPSRAGLRVVCRGPASRLPRACVPFAVGLRATCLHATVSELLLRQRAALCASASAPPAWAPCLSSSSGSVRRHVQVLQLRRVGHRVVQVLQPCQRGHRVRAPLAAVCGAMCKCFSSAELGTVLGKCFSPASVGTVFEHL